MWKMKPRVGRLDGRLTVGVRGDFSLGLKASWLRTLPWLIYHCRPFQRGLAQRRMPANHNFQILIRVLKASPSFASQYSFAISIVINVSFSVRYNLHPLSLDLSRRGRAVSRV